MIYQVGDRVKIKENLSESSCVNERMDKWQGKEMTIRAIECDRYYKMREDMDNFRGNLTPGWDWYEDTIEGLAEPEKLDAVGMKYKVGDRVKIKDIDEFVKCFGINQGGLMNHHAGTVMTVREVATGYFMEEDTGENYGDGWVWGDDMIEGLAEETEATVKDSGVKDSGNRRTFASGAERDIQEGKGRCDLLPACAVLRLARHYEAGAKKYNDRNWEKGIPVHSFIDSAIRHLMNYLDGQTDEDHLCAAAWNLMGAMWTEEKHPELQDIPARLEEEKDE
ncbi:DUF5664 domain-containing protein [bacterium 210820-DFI.6.37]|nr:DUF5664 domain-containing protein [bacterium 210820-DFI.6.37]